MMTIELKLHPVEAFTQMDNLGSQHVLRNNGFAPIGVARSRIFIAGARYGYLSRSRMAR
jgi:[ribosomal protein S5]-alanine N-acetyltransferase